MPTVVALTARSALRSASRNSSLSRGTAWTPTTVRGVERLPIVRLATPACEAGVCDRACDATGAGHDHAGARERAAHGQLGAGAKAGRVSVEADKPAIRRSQHVVDRADLGSDRFDLVDERCHERLIRRR